MAEDFLDIQGGVSVFLVRLQHFYHETQKTMYLKMYFRSVIVFKEMSKVSFILKKFNCKKKAVCGLEMCLPFLNISLTSQKYTTELLEWNHKCL